MLLFRISNHICACLLIQTRMEAPWGPGLGCLLVSVQHLAWARACCRLSEPTCCFNEQRIPTLRWWDKWQQSGRPLGTWGPRSLVSLCYDLGSEWSCGVAPVWTQQYDMPTKWSDWPTHRPQSKAEAHKYHYFSTLSSFLALLVKYAWYIKIIVQTEGLTVAQSRPGKCLNHSVGGVAAGAVGNVPGVGTETTPGNGIVGNNLHILGHGRFWNCICSLHFHHWNELFGFKWVADVQWFGWKAT